MSRYDSQTIAALHEALDDEYKARATYQAVIERHGAVRPFTNIIAAEDRHARALERLLQADGLPLPPDRWVGKVTAPETLQQAYALGVQAEIDNRTMYDRLENMTREPEVLRVFSNLRAASQDNHLPAFQRHLDRTNGNIDPAMPWGGQGQGGRGGGQGGRGHGRGRWAQTDWNGAQDANPATAGGDFGPGGYGRGQGCGCGGHGRHGGGYRHGQTG